MPIVPVARQERVKEERYANFRVNTEVPAGATGGGPGSDWLAHAATKLGGDALDYVVEERKAADKIKVNEAENAISEWEAKKLHDAQTGALNRKGKDAFSVPDEVDQSFDAVYAEIEKGLTSNEQKLEFRARAAARYKDINRQVQHHVAGEKTRYDTEQTNALIGNERNAAIFSLDPARIGSSIKRQEDAILGFAKRNGLSPNDESVKQQLLNAKYETHEGVIQRHLAQGNDLKAQQYYNTVKPGLEGTDTKKIELALEEGSRLGAAMRFTDQVMATPGMTMQQALDEARDKLGHDAKLRQRAEDRIKDQYGLKKAADEEGKRQRYDSADDMLEQTRDITKVQQSPLWLELSGDQRHQLEERFRQIRDGIPAEKFSEDYYNLRMMAATPELRGKFLRTNLREYKGKISNEELESLIDAQTQAKSGNTSKLDGIRSDMEIVKTELEAAGFKPNAKPGTKEAQEYAYILGKVDEQITAKQAATGKKIAGVEVKDVVTNIVPKVVTDKGWLWNTRKRIYELSPDEDFSIEPSAIPKAEVEKIKDALRRQGVTKPTDAQLTELYKRKLMRGRRGAAQ